MAAWPPVSTRADGCGLAAHAPPQVWTLAVHEGLLLGAIGDSSIKVWRIDADVPMEDWEQVGILSGHRGLVLALAVYQSRGTRRHVSLSAWPGHGTTSLPLPAANAPLALSPRRYKDRLISGSDDRCIRVWRMGSWECERTLTGHNGGVVGVCFIQGACVPSRRTPAMTQRTELAPQTAHRHPPHPTSPAGNLISASNDSFIKVRCGTVASHQPPARISLHAHACDACMYDHSPPHRSGIQAACSDHSQRSSPSSCHRAQLHSGEGRCLAARRRRRRGTVPGRAPPRPREAHASGLGEGGCGLL